jgi:acyl carrier protein
MKRSNVFDAVKEEIKKINDCGEDIKDDSRLKEDLGLDSLSVVSLIASLEERFGIMYNDSELDPDNLTDVKSVTELTEKYV